MSDKRSKTILNNSVFLQRFSSCLSEFLHVHTHTHTHKICIPIHVHTLSTTTYHPPRRSLERDAYSGDICCWKQHFQVNIPKALGTNILKSSQRKLFLYFGTHHSLSPSKIIMKHRGILTRRRKLYCWQMAQW